MSDRLLAYAYNGFWAPMDTIKDRQILEGHFESGRCSLGGLAAPHGAHVNGR